MVSLHLVALGLYGLTTGLVVAPFAGGRSASRALVLGVPLSGAALHVVALSGLSFVGLAPSLSLFALFLILLQVVSDRVFRTPAVALFTAPLAAGFVGLALLIGMGDGTARGGREAWLVLHVALSVLGIALLALAFVSAALYLLQFRELKAKRFGRAFQLFPPLERLDRLNQLALTAGFPALTLGVLLAVGYAIRFADGAAAMGKAQVVWGAFTWLVLGWSVWVRHVRHWAGRRAAVASIAGFAAVMLVYLALKLTAPGTGRFL